MTRDGRLFFVGPSVRARRSPMHNATPCVSLSPSHSVSSVWADGIDLLILPQRARRFLLRPIATRARGGPTADLSVLPLFITVLRDNRLDRHALRIRLPHHQSPNVEKSAVPLLIRQALAGAIAAAIIDSSLNAPVVGLLDGGICCSMDSRTLEESRACESSNRRPA